ncbi:hypothetical protein [Paenibacillus senegalimassiliensis]|uniref:hypothetical protein n=1 Tax=Paenibacillus senegalimassiliensis TaxID=1737426 RepID=UPI0012FD1E68|nr:hypothetical protein [Paenibacillus senegalimassiliensis]
MPSFGIEPERLENLLKNLGIQDEKIIVVVKGIFDINNRMIEAHVDRMINEALDRRLK